MSLFTSRRGMAASSRTHHHAWHQLLLRNKNARTCTVIVSLLLLVWFSWPSWPLDDDGAVVNESALKDSNNNKIKHILFYNSFWNKADWAFGFGQEPFLDNNCPVNNCYTTNDRNLLPSMSDFDAVAFHTPIGFDPKEKEMKEIQKWRRPEQRFVMFDVESPANYPFNYKLLNNFFNWTMTYRVDSDIPRPYGWFTSKKDPDRFYQPTQDDISSQWTPDFDYSHFVKEILPRKDKQFLALADRPKKVAIIVSNCKTSSKREQYLKELKKHIDVDVFGKCGTIKCDKKFSPEGGDSCSKAVENDYKFYLSFENSLCKHYVTEKLFGRVSTNVAVVMGGAEYDSVAPPHSYIHAMDYDSPKDLAAYLHELEVNKTLYLSYFWWKDYYDVHMGNIKTNHARSMCKLCEKLNEANAPSKTYEDIGKWWDEGAECKGMR